MLQTTDDEALSTQATANKKNQDALVSVDGGIVVGGSIKNLSTIVNLAKSKKSKSKANIAKANSGTDFLISRAKKAFIHLQRAFIEAPILKYFDPEHHIWTGTDASGYAIGGVLSQMTSDQHSSGHVTHEDPNSSKSEIGQWYPVAFFFQKMIPAETWYKTYNQELLAIVEAFKTWCHYLEGCKYKVLVLTDYNNLCWFMDTKSLSSRQVCWAQELSQYHF